MTRIFLCAVLALSFTACKKNKKKSTNGAGQPAVEQAEVGSDADEKSLGDEGLVVTAPGKVKTPFTKPRVVFTKLVNSSEDQIEKLKPEVIELTEKYLGYHKKLYKLNQKKKEQIRGYNQILNDKGIMAEQQFNILESKQFSVIVDINREIVAVLEKQDEVRALLIKNSKLLGKAYLAKTWFSHYKSLMTLSDKLVNKAATTETYKKMQKLLLAEKKKMEEEGLEGYATRNMKEFLEYHKKTTESAGDYLKEKALAFRDWDIKQHQAMMKKLEEVSKRVSEKAEGYGKALKEKANADEKHFLEKLDETENYIVDLRSAMNDLSDEIKKNKRAIDKILKGSREAQVKQSQLDDLRALQLERQVLTLEYAEYSRLMLKAVHLRANYKSRIKLAQSIQKGFEKAPELKKQLLEIKKEADESINEIWEAGEGKAKKAWDAASKEVKEAHDRYKERREQYKKDHKQALEHEAHGA